MGGEVGGEDGGAALAVGAGDDDRVVAVAGDEVGIGFEGDPVVAAEGEGGVGPVEPGDRGVGGIDDLEAKPRDDFDPVLVRRDGDGQDLSITVPW